MKLFILAGEPSGDHIAADLVSRLRQRLSFELSGVGGTELIAQGLKSLFPMRELSVVGGDILPRIPWLYFRAWQTARAIFRSKPDIIVFVDAQLFSATVAKMVRKRGVKVPILLYVSPSVWAWGPDRAKKLVPLFDEVMAVLPFEPAVMERLGGPPTSYVGHPALHNMPQRKNQPDKGPLLLLPGSRDRELNNNLPLMRVVAEQLAGHPKVTGFILPTLASLRERVAAEVATWRVPVEVVTGGAARRKAQAEAVAACVAMGTATLEVALAGVPMIGMYRLDAKQWERVRKFKLKHISLPNNVLGEGLVTEVMYEHELDPVPLVEAMRTLLDSDPGPLLAGFARLRRLMEEGPPDHPVTDVVDRVLSHVPAQRLSSGT